MEAERQFRNIEFYDSHGRAIRAWSVNGFGRPSNNEGYRRILNLDLPDPTDGVAELRYYGRLRMEQEVGFEFEQVTLPR
jgi:hypothetical protein